MKKLLPLILIVPLIIIACTKQQAQSADAVAVDLTNAVCIPLENQPLGQPWVDIVCTVAQGIEQGVNVATGRSGVATPIDAGSVRAAVRTVTIRLASADAPAFLAAHAAPALDAGGG